MVLPPSMDLATTAPMFCAGVTGKMVIVLIAVRAKRTNPFAFVTYHAVKKCGLQQSDCIAIIECGGLDHPGNIDDPSSLLLETTDGSKQFNMPVNVIIHRCIAFLY